MGNSSGGLGSLIAAILKFLVSLFRGAKPPTSAIAAQPVLPPDNTTEPTRIVTSRVLLIVYDPVVDTATGQKLSEKMGWNRVDDLVAGFTADILEHSGGLAKYQIVERIDMNEFPAKIDGFRYDPQSYMAVLNKSIPPHKPEWADYQAILAGFNILPQVAGGLIDEVWIFAFPHAGFYESRMAGAGMFWCNAPPLENTSQCPRKFVIMGFSYERGVGEMLESFGHRAESILAKAFNSQDFLTWAYRPDRTPATAGPSLNPFQRYICFDGIAPGKAAIGTIHHAPNSDKDYNWNNPRLVDSDCDDWYNFPAFQNVVRQVGADDWGNGNIREHHRWWLKHLPKVAGRTSGVANNWWQYILDPNLLTF